MIALLSGRARSENGGCSIHHIKPGHFCISIFVIYKFGPGSFSKLRYSFTYKQVHFCPKFEVTTMLKRTLYLNRLIRSMWNGEVKIITGIGGCGKSVLLFDLFYEYLLTRGTADDHILKIELDQRRYYRFRDPVVLCEYIEGIVQDKKGEQFYLFIDEV